MTTENDEPATQLALPQPDSRLVANMPPVELAPVSVACAKLSEAVGLARDRCKAAAKDGWNDYHKYKYASADEVIQTAKNAMDGTGLAIIPQSQELTVVGSGNAAIYALNRTIFLSHSSGEYVPLTIRGWPVIPERGRPLDKAFAVALTTSLSYLLRDLLQMPREDGTDMNQRDDRKAEPARPPEQNRNQTVAKPTATDPTLLQMHAKTIEEAESLEELSMAWKSVNVDSKANRITGHELGRLNALKETRKRELAGLPPGETGDPDDDPFANASEERRQLEATK